jgi:hypothetical protein
MANSFITRLSSKYQPLVKRFTLTDGRIEKIPAGQLYGGTAEVLQVDTACELAEHLGALDAHQAIALGRLKAGMTAELTVRDLAGGGLIARTRNYFEYHAEPGWLLLDVDLDALPDDVRRRIDDLGGPIRALETVWPALADAERLIRPSSSAGVHRPGETPKDSGWHVFVRLSDVSKSREALTNLHDLCWSRGLGWIKLSRDGRMLERSLVDTCVSQPHRIVYCAEPEVEAGLLRDPPATEPRPGDTLDPPDPPPDLDEVPVRKDRARERIRPGAEERRRAYTREKVDRVVEESGVSREHAEWIVRSRLASAYLHDHDVIELDDGSKTRVGDLLDTLDPGERPLKRSMPDPIEGRAYGRGTATLIWNEPYDKPIIVSHAHGEQRVFRFRRAGRDAPYHATFDALDPSDAREALGRTIRQVFWVFDQPAVRNHQVLVQADLGLGKTRATAAALVERLEAQRKAGRTDTAAVIAVPENRLSDEITRVIETAVSDAGSDLRVAAIRGLQSLRPDKRDKMCARWNERMKPGLEEQRARRDICNECNVVEACKRDGYLAQQSLVADIYVVAHKALTRKPVTTTGERKQELDVLVVDESPVASLIETGDNESDLLPLDSLSMDVFDGLGEDEAEELRMARDRVRRALEDCDRVLTKQALENAGVSAEHARKVELELGRKASASELPRGVKRAIPQMWRLFREIADLLEAPDRDHTARIWVERSGKGDRRIVQPRMEDIHVGWRTQTLLIDATPEPSLLRQWWRHLHQKPPIRAAAPHARILQDCSKSYGKSMLLSTAVKDGRSASQRREEILAFVRRISRNSSKVGLIGYKDLIAKFTKDVT